MKKLLFSLLIGLFLCTIVARGQDKYFSLENTVRQYAFMPRIVDGLNSMADGQHYCSIVGGDLVMYSYKNGKASDTLVKGEDLVLAGSGDTIQMKSYRFNQDETKMLIPTQTEKIYRRSEKSEYYIWDLTSKELTRLSEHGKQRLADFSPDGTKVAFVRKNNLFIKDLLSGDEKQITFDGKDRYIINGTTDWVYEEEFAITKGFYWSPDGKTIAYYKFDESGVPEYEMQVWGELYPEMHRYKYPKAGEDNSIVSIHFYDLRSGKTISAELGEETDQYIPRIKWSKKAGMLAIQRLNRLQNHLEILLSDRQNGKSRVVYDETNKYYIDITDHLIFTDEDHFLISSEADGFLHIYYHDLETNTSKQLSSGQWDVTELLGYDSKREKVYFEAAKSSPLNRDLMQVDLKGEMKVLSKREGSNSAEFSANYDYYINTYSDANTPPYITLNKNSGKELRVLQDNKELIEKLKEYGFSEYSFFTVPGEDGSGLNAWRINPPDFDPDKPYPVLMYVYGGPGSQTVTNSWSGNLWFQVLAQKGIVCISVDNRGTGARGEEFKKMTYQQLGKYETLDQIAAAKYLSGKSWADPDRIAIFGWSYGGFMSTLCMTKGAEVFDVGIAVAPVTNWKYYDNIYTERFMRTPRENPDGYENNSPINFTDHLKGKYMLVHGTADDNVHVQNTLDLVTSLVAADKDFELMLYPNKNHGIYGGNTRYHLYRKMTSFLLENLK